MVVHIVYKNSTFVKEYEIVVGFKKDNYTIVKWKHRSRNCLSLDLIGPLIGPSDNLDVFETMYY